jgi:adenine phosphoribosyltransferase
MVNPAQGSRMSVSDLRKTIREVPDFPRPGINFYDVTTLFRDASAFRSAVDHLVERYRSEPLDGLVGIEARGFVLASAMAYRLGTGLVLARKPGKLPCAAESESYELEYGQAQIEIHHDAVTRGENILVVDDVLATGGTARAAGAVVERLGGRVHGFAFLIELSFLSGRERVGTERVYSLLQYGA